MIRNAALVKLMN